MVGKKDHWSGSSAFLL